MKEALIHSLAEALAVLAAADGQAVRFYSAQSAVSFLGAPGFAALIEAATARYPSVECEAVLDCGASPGLALAALRQGIKAITLAAPPATLAAVADIAHQYGARLASPLNK